MPSRCVVSVALLLAMSPAAPAEDYERNRARMVELIRQDVADTSRYIGKASLDDRVMDVMGRVPRHLFVPQAQRRLAYENRPLPIGHGQTISQPYIVALMTDLLELTPEHRVLELGTGSGYQAAVLAEIAAEVYTIEIIEPLGREARARLGQLDYANVHVEIGDGYYGLEAQAPFDAIVVTAAASHVPPPLVRQLKIGGRMVVPVGTEFMVQQLLLVEKQSPDTITTRQILPVRFVPLTGGH